MEEERAWELFARAQGELFERALDQVKAPSQNGRASLCSSLQLPLLVLKWLPPSLLFAGERHRAKLNV